MLADEDDTVIVPPSRERTGDVADTDDTVIRGAGARQPTRSAGDESPPVIGLYSFVIGEGASAAVLLDRPARVGRKPTAPRVSSGSLARLIRVASPRREVSATHIELSQVGSSVVVTDLRSTNGSTVLLPGAVPRKLRQGESVVVSPGTLVDIGDGNIIQILPMNHRGTDLRAGRQL